MRLIRIDKRLIHANTIDFWVKPLKVSRVMVCDDDVAIDPLKQIGYKMCIPSDLQLHFLKVGDVNDFINEEASNVMWLFKGIGELVRSNLSIFPTDWIAISPYLDETLEEGRIIDTYMQGGLQVTRALIYTDGQAPL